MSESKPRGLSDERLFEARLAEYVSARDEMISGRALTWPLLVGLLLTLAGSGYLWVTYEIRATLPVEKSPLAR